MSRFDEATNKQSSPFTENRPNLYETHQFIGLTTTTSGNGFAVDYYYYWQVEFAVMLFVCLCLCCIHHSN